MKPLPQTVLECVARLRDALHGTESPETGDMIVDTRALDAAMDDLEYAARGKLSAQRVAIVGACHCGITNLALDSIDSGMAETCPTCGDVIVFDVQSPEARARQFASVPDDAALDAIVANLDDCCSCEPESGVEPCNFCTVSCAITALRRQLAAVENTVGAIRYALIGGDAESALALASSVLFAKEPKDA